MADREKVIRGLEVCKTSPEFREECAGCPYDDGQEDCIARMAADALELLKAQEPKPPIVKENAYGWKFFYCPSCGREFNANRKHGCVNAENFCDKCGQAVKWDERT